MAQQYIGSRISLISKSDIRYRGILHSIDPAASTVSLEQVRSMGTEGRKSNPSEEIAPTDQLYEFIVFRAADVKDLSIESPAEPKPEPPKPPVPDDPAIMSTTAPPRAAPFMQPPMMAGPQGMYNNHMPPMMYPPGGVPPQWPPYALPPQGQLHPMMGFPQPAPPPSAPPQQTNNQITQPHTQPLSKVNPPSAAPSNQAKPGGSPKIQKAPPITTSSPTKQPAPNPAPTNSSAQPFGSASAIPSSQLQAPSGANGTAGPKPLFGSSTAMDMMASMVAMGSQQGGSPGAANPTAPLKTSSLTAHTTKSSQPSFGHPGSNSAVNHHHNVRSNGKEGIPSGYLPSSSHSQQHHMRHPLPQVPNKSKPVPRAHGGARPGSHKINHGGHHHQPSSASIVPAQDFDFASANAKFTKPAPASHHQAKPDDPTEQKQFDTVPELTSTDGQLSANKQAEFVIPEAPPGTYYDKKKSFFDDISSEVKERSAVTQDSKGAPSSTNGAASVRGGRGGGRGARGKGYDRNAERQKNLDTFGEVALNPNLGALGSGYNGYGRGGLHRAGQTGGNVNGYRGMGGRGGRGRGNSSSSARGGGGVGANARAAPAGLISPVAHHQQR